MTMLIFKLIGSFQSFVSPPSKLFREYLRCRQLSSLNGLPCKIRS